MSQTFKIGVLASFLCLFNGCGVTVQGIDLGRVVGAGSKVFDIGEKSQEQEIDIGRDTAEALLSRSMLAADDQLQQYVNRVGYWLAQHSERPDLPWRFVVLNNSAANAFAAPGGYVFITTGMLARVYNEAELAGVLAHEIAHVTQKHHLAALQGQSRKGLLGDVLVLAQQGRKRDDERSRSSGATTHFDDMVLDLYGRGLNREDEYRADALGAQIVARAGYDHYGFTSVLQALGGRDKGEADMTLFLKTHPPIDDRLQQLEAVLLLLDERVISSRILAGRYIRHSRAPVIHES